ncbi:aspartate 1-decarboxylase precursor [bacterium BMS3Abin09]|nr:aspartate 1-decarboxylase precursor [bacterium BMS3Abin09]GBE41202.1 aspartate 1-decarboxylase precursor [bacterium BMS3Bbin09]HDH34565.1 aspartate 1-decarboxylase [Nitrospirota bacterium]HDN94660.1 aspartate 1-decarboxylase [Nitrospirota bacterium]HDO67350.1 aspartate 1-decarboxylase [Nitrospirota bacterium]
MLRSMLRAKIHQATITDANIEYEGSLTVDEDLLDAVGIIQFEQVKISNLNNGERFETYIIPGKRGSGKICLNGAAARKGLKGDRIIIFSYGYYTEDEIEGFAPKIIRLDENNNIIK